VTKLSTSKLVLCCIIHHTVFPLIEAGSQIKAGSLIQAGGQTSCVPIQAGSLIEAGSLTEAGGSIKANIIELIAHTPVAL